MLQFSNVRGSSYDPSSTIKQAMFDVDFSGFYIRVKGLDGGGFGLRKTHLKKEDALKALSEKSMNWMGRKADIQYDPKLGNPPASLVALFQPLEQKMIELMDVTGGTLLVLQVC